MPKNGRILRLMAARLSPEIEQETIRQIPMGGVSMPMARFVTTITPNWTISTPRDGSMAVIIGTSRIREAVVSTNVPAMSRTRLISKQQVDRIVRQVEQRTGQAGGDVFNGGDPAEYRGRCNDKHDNRRGDRPVSEKRTEISQSYFAVNQHADDQGINDRHSGGFSGRENTKKNAAQDDYRCTESQEAHF